MKIDGEAIVTALKAAIPYIPVTLRLAVIPLLIGMLLGLMIAFLRFYRVPIVAKFLAGMITVGKGIPIILSLMVAYLVFSDVFDQLAQAKGWAIQFKDINREYIAMSVLSLYASISLSEIFRGALVSIPKDQWDAATSIGLTQFQTIYRVVLPQLLPITLPMLCNQLIVLIKASALVSMVSVVDVLNGALITATTSYSFLEAYIAAAMIYWGLSIIIEQLSGLIERYYARKFVRGSLV
ncbi:ABC transporter permease subunit [Enterococcus saccharolyticus]|uniref:Amino acid ABC transporter permease n=1 Tax=Candidatus Enterococcus willemsii TaxID=1857215 RepID=A0ABQ6YZL8_9ENTE|nr:MULTISPECIES: ABC transporter permease subunit [Enterococcus]KAF1304052.1 amino acid ABC transporter permease [Enterococcus sp. CU12B]MCD5002087.1 ABC transporter permease subunit [Enterococcus saccharolyticus]